MDVRNFVIAVVAIVVGADSAPDAETRSPASSTVRAARFGRYRET